ncbi:hypothetical protein [Microcoleus sp. Pol10D4]|uniref:hypothetical protein n=1 Tax=Microcoleus sp. Pol10D4 TaxID=3055387 RepID=UPI002FD68A92
MLKIRDCLKQLGISNSLGLTPIKETGFFSESVAATKYYRKKTDFWVAVLSPNFKKIWHRELK